MFGIRPFQVMLYFTFAVLFFLALVLLSGYAPGQRGADSVGPVVVWGTFEEAAVKNAFASMSRASDANARLLQSVQYRQVDERSFDSQLSDAIIGGTQPDIILMPHTKLVQHRTKLFPLDEQLLPRRTYMDTYIDGAEIFMRSDAVYAFPVMVDPLVLFWNRDIFASNGLTQAPRTWEQVINNIVPTIVRRTPDRRISVSPIAFGVYDNNRNALPAISMLLLQSGSAMVQEQNGVYQVNLNSNVSDSSRPLETTLQFFTRFANPSDPLYSWMSSKNEDRSEFVAGTLAMYFGFGSEVQNMQRQNPNLNFDVATVPQGDSTTIPRTYADFYGLALLRSSNNLSGAYRVAQFLGNSSNAKILSDQFLMVPPHRSTVGAGTPSPAGQVSYSSVVFARGWLNPEMTGTDSVFRQSLSDAQSGRQSMSAAARDLLVRLRDLY